MGQAVVDLPDPLEQPPASAASADDLLAQLAGDEIDRLLSDAEAEAPTAEPVVEVAAPVVAPAGVAPSGVLPAGVATTAVSPPVVSSDAPALAAAAGALQDATATVDQPLQEPAAQNKDKHASTPNGQADSTAGAGHAQTPLAESAEIASANVPNPNQPADTAAELDAILNSASSKDGSSSAVDIDSAVAAAADKILSPKIEAARQAGDTVEAPAKSEESSERDGLLAAVAGEPETDDEPPAPLPLWLRPLEWINAPVNDAPDRVREFLGKAAILTLVNSAAVIVYVLMFRKH